MLKKILLYIKENGEFSDRVIAKDLNIDEGMVSQMKSQLIQMGYIKKVEKETCSYACKSCSQGCNSRNLSNVSEWKITEKGINAIK